MVMAESTDRVVVFSGKKYILRDVPNIMRRIGYVKDCEAFENEEKMMLYLMRFSDIGALIVDATTYDPDTLVDLVMDIYGKNKGDKLKLLVIFEETEANRKTLSDLRTAIEATSDTCKTCILPYTNADFLAAFDLKAAPPPPPKIKVKKKAKPVSQAKPAPKKSKSNHFLDASKHLSVTVEKINELAKNRKALDMVAEIGQRFNGLVGTFAFFQSHKNYQNIYFLSRVVDEICRTYELNTNLEEIKKEHFDLLLNSAKNLFQILKAMREGKELPEKQIALYNQIGLTYKEMDDIAKRQNQSQDDVDSLLEELSEDN